MTSVPLVDFHCHLDLYPDLAEAIRRSEEQGVFTLAVTTTPRAWAHNEALTASTQYVRAALGLHPQLVANHAPEIALFEELLPCTRYVGEVGLDAGPRFYRSIEQQKEIFECIIKLCALARDKIVSIHSVRATKMVLDILEKNMPATHGRVVLHWFTGSAAEARRAVELGCYFSVNSEMLANPKRTAIVEGVPLQRLLTETDGPFTVIDGRPCEPRDVETTVNELARQRSCSPESMRKQIVSNLKDVLVLQ